MSPRLAVADTFVSGTLSSNTTWTLAQSPFIVTSPLRVPAGITLTIQPGVVVRFEPSTNMTIEGTLIARGTILSKILFTSTAAEVTPGLWGQLNFAFSATDAVYDAGGNWIGGSVLEHAIIEGAGIGNTAAINFRDTRPLFESVTIRKSSGGGIDGYISDASQGTVKIRNCDLNGSSTGYEYGIDLFYSGSVTLEGNRIENYTVGLYIYQFYPGSPTPGAFPGTLLVSRNRLIGNTRYGIYAASIWLEARYLDNVITGNGVGALLAHQFGLHTIEIARNIVDHNRERGMYVTNRGITTGGGSLTITRNIFADNIGSNAGGTYTGSSGGLHAEFDGPATVTQNVFASNVDPGFVGAADFRLETGSLDFSRNLVVDNIGSSASGLEISSDGASAVTLSDNTFTQNAAMSKPPVLGRPAAVRVYSFFERTGSFALHGNNFFGNTTGLSGNRYSLFIDGMGIPVADATGNWWGTNDPATIDSLVAYGPSEAGTNRTLVVSTPALTGINTDAPISPPTGLVVTRSGNNASLTWSANPEIDVAGYRVWYGVPGDLTYSGTGAAQGASPIDVGAVTSFQLTGLPAGAVVTVSAYDTQRDGVNDFTDGHESWYATVARLPLALTSLTADRTPPLPASNLSVLFTAKATGGRQPYRYMWQVWNGSQWSAGYWSSNDTFSWYIDTANPNYRVRVSVQSVTNLTDDADNAGSVGVMDFPIDPPTPMTAASINPQYPSPRQVGDFLFFVAEATGGSTYADYKWRLSTDGGATYTTVQDWAYLSPYFSWSPTTAVPNARINVWVRSHGNTTDAPQAQATISYAVFLPPALTSITSDVAAPQASGTTITFTAGVSGGIAPLQYKWFIFDGSAWTVTQNWSTSPTFAWTPAIASSAYRVGVWIRNANSNVDGYANANSNGSIPYAITAQPGAVTVTGLTSNLASPQMAGTAITFTASATGGTPPLQYKWRLSTNGGTSYSTLQDWSTNPTLVWTPASPIADARINVWARGSGVTADAPQSQATVAYQITTGPLILTGITPTLASPQTTGTGITFIANATGGVTPRQYKWWLHVNGSWSVVRDWSTSSSFFWTPSVTGTYRVAVWVRNWGNTADLYENANSNGSIEYVVTNAAVPLSITSLTSNLASPQVSGTAITFGVASSGGTTPHQYKWRVSTDGGASFATAQDWSTNASFTWTPGGAIADARINVWARNSGITADAPQAQSTVAYVITVPSAGALVLNSIIPSVAAPQTAGTTITFTANTSGGTAPHQYKWWIFDGGWQVVRQWSTDNTFTWTPTSPSTAYRVAVWVRNAGSSADAYDNANSNASIGYVITAGAAPLTTNLTANAASPQVVGTAISFTATAGGGTAPYQFKWRVSIDGGTTFTTAQDWSSNASFTWTPGNAIADARITVWARNSGVTADAPQAQATLSYVITTPSTGPLVLNSIVPSLPSPQPTGTAVTFTANASGGTGPYQYKWWIFDGGWQVVRQWSTDNTFTWTATSPSSAYRVAVWVRNASSTADAYDNANSNASIGYVITAGASPLTVTNLTANAASPQVVGTAITFTATAGGGTAPYQFKWRISIDGGTSFTTVQDWSSSASFTWQTAMPVADARIAVWARNSGVTADTPQAQATMGYVIAAPSAGPLVLNSIVPNLSAPRTAGTSITFTANASGGTGPYQYKWWIFDGSWQVVRQWSTDSTFTWTPTNPSSAYRIGVWVRNAGSTADAYDNANSNSSIAFVIVP